MVLKLKTDVGLSEYRVSPNPVVNHNCLHQNGQLEGIPHVQIEPLGHVCQ